MLLALVFAAHAWANPAGAQDRPLAPLEGEIRAVVAVASRPPDPAKAPYKDCLSQIKVRLTRPCEKLGLAKDAEALLVVWLFQNRKPGPGMQLRAGHEISARLLPYAVVEAGLTQTMRVDETNDFASPVFWVNSFKITGGTPQEFPPLPAEPAPAPAPGAPAPEKPQGNGVVDRILRVIEAHGAETIVDPTTQLRFGANRSLIKPQFWLSKYSKTWSPLHLPPIDAIADFHRHLERRGIELVMVFPPVAAAVYPDLAANIAWDMERDGRADRYFVQFAEEIRKLGITVVDVLPVLYSHRYVEGPDGRVQTIYSASDSHWTPMGARLAARQVADAIRKQPWHAQFTAGNAVAPFKFTEQTEYSISGKALPEDLGLAPFAPPPVPCLASRIIPEPGSPSLKDLSSPDGPVHVIGDSFTWTGEEQDSSFCQHLAAALGVPVGRSAIAAGATSASLYRFAREAPLEKLKTVVWEIAMGLADGESAPWIRSPLERGRVLALLCETGRFGGGGATLESAELVTRDGVSMRAIKADLSNLVRRDSAEPTIARIGWRGIRLGQRPILLASLALAETAPKSTDSPPGGADFVVRIDRRRVSRTKMRTDDYVLLQVDLLSFAGQTVNLDLEIELDPNFRPAVAYWGNPEVLDGEILQTPAGGSTSR